MYQYQSLSCLHCFSITKFDNIPLCHKPFAALLLQAKVVGLKTSMNHSVEIEKLEPEWAVLVGMPADGPIGYGPSMPYSTRGSFAVALI